MANSAATMQTSATSAAPIAIGELRKRMPEVAVEKARPAAGRRRERQRCRCDVAPLGGDVGAAGRARRVAYLDFSVIHLKYM